MKKKHTLFFVKLQTQHTHTNTQETRGRKIMKHLVHFQETLKNTHTLFFWKIQTQYTHTYTQETREKNNETPGSFVKKH